MEEGPQKARKLNASGVTIPYPCGSCVLETPHRTLGIHPDPRHARKTVRLLECLECRETVAIPGPVAGGTH